MNNQEFINALKLFNEKGDKLKSCSFCKIIFGQKIGVTLFFKPGEAPKTERRGPDEESIDAFILTFRFFIQDNERSSFKNVAEIYSTLPISLERKQIFKNVRKNLNEFLDSDTMFNIDNHRLKNREILDIFIYGGLSHANERKKKIFDSWKSIPPLKTMLENEFVVILGKVMNCIIYVQGLNEQIIKELTTPTSGKC